MEHLHERGVGREVGLLDRAAQPLEGARPRRRRSATTSGSAGSPRLGDQATRSPGRSPSSAPSQSSPVSGSDLGSRSSGPAHTDMSSAASRVVQVSGPMHASVSKYVRPVSTGMRPSCGLRPSTPQHDAGMRIEPPASDPPPPAERRGDGGRRPARRAAWRPCRIPRVDGGAERRVARRGRVPELRRHRLADHDPAGRERPLDDDGVVSGTCPANRVDPKLVSIPRVGVRSLMATGTPCSAPSGSPASTAASARRACRRACPRGRCGTRAARDRAGRSGRGTHRAPRPARPPASGRRGPGRSRRAGAARSRAPAEA